MQGLICCGHCLGTDIECASCHNTRNVLCDECGDVEPYAAAEVHTEAFSLCGRCVTKALNGNGNGRNG
jgi:hypothetical protein